MAVLGSAWVMITISGHVWAIKGLILNSLHHLCFVQLLTHDTNLEPPKFMNNTSRVRVITCPFLQAEVRANNIVSLDNMTSRLLLVAFKNQHFAVLQFDIHQHKVSVFDGLCRKIDQWKMERACYSHALCVQPC